MAKIIFNRDNEYIRGRSTSGFTIYSWWIQTDPDII